MLSAHLWAIIGICAGFVAGMAVVFRFLCPDEPRNDTGEDLARGPDEDDPDALLAAA